MKILQLIHKIQNRGAETFACQLSNHLLDEGNEVIIVALYEGKAKLPYKKDILVLDEYPKIKFLNYHGWKKLNGIIKEFNPDIIQANSGDTLKYSIFSKLIFGWKQPIIFRNASEVGRYLKSPLQKIFNKFLYRKVSWIISVSQASKKDLISHFSFLSDKIDVIGVGLEPINLHVSRALKPKNAKHIVHVGGFSFEKNHVGLLDIFQLVLKKYNNVHLHLVGDGPLIDQIKELTMRRNLSRNVSFYGFVSDSLTYIESADVLVLPSIIEGLPGVILESMSCKTPVVAYNVGGISEILDKRSGNLISPEDKVTFSEAVINNLKNPDSSQIDYAYNFVNTNFLNSKLTLKFITTYEKVLNVSL